MFEFQKLCREVETLSPQQRGALLLERSAEVIEGLRKLADPDLDPVGVLASFIVGSVVVDGSISEKDYLFIYPSLAKAFGEACDLAGIKHSFKVSKDARKAIASFTEQLLSILAAADDTLAADIVSLCLLVTSVDGKISLREKRYIKQLCRA